MLDGNEVDGTRMEGNDAAAAAPAPAPAGATPVLAARGLYRFRPVNDQQVPILRDVSFALQPREFAAIMGPSGSGKSTLLHLLAGLERPSAGEIAIAGETLTGLDEERLAAIRRAR